MKNSKLRRVLMLVASAVLLVSLSVGATLAYLTSTTQVVTNTFSVGKVKITLDEAVTDKYGTPTTGRTETGNEYKLIPGHTYTKDPVVHVQTESEECYVFVKIENNISDILAYQSVEQQMVDDPATEAENDGKWIAMGNNIYVYKQIVDARNGQVDVPTFTYFKVKDNVENAPEKAEDRVDGTLYVEDYTTAANANNTIKITAYAIQADGFGTATYETDAAAYYAQAEKAWKAGFEE